MYVLSNLFVNGFKNDFISSISHEIRTPLTSIKGWGETLNSIGNEDHQLFSQGMEIIINETERLSVMVEDLLDFSRLEGKSELNYYFEDLDLLDELNDAVNTVQQRANKLGIKVNYDAPYDEIMYSVTDKPSLNSLFDVPGHLL